MSSEPARCYEPVESVIFIIWLTSSLFLLARHPINFSLAISALLLWWLKQPLSNISTHRKSEGTLRGDHGSEAEQMFCQIYWLRKAGGAQECVHTQTHTDIHAHALTLTINILHCMDDLVESSTNSLHICFIHIITFNISSKCDLFQIQLGASQVQRD